ncbi:MAG TPA: serine/threonine-protein kinase [Oculatellaceae cyanobacterium]
MGSETSKKACLACSGEFSAAFDSCPNDGSTLVALDNDGLTGTTLDGRYEILQVVGSGGMGTVYRATQKFINRTVAVKVLRKGSITNTEILQRFQLEAQAASKLSNPHIVTVFDSNVSPSGEPYMVMDFLQGKSLDDVIKTTGPLSAARAIPIFMQACDALSKAHAKGIVHRDIKPSNIMLVKEDNEDDFVKLVDFGIAKMLQGNETPQLTRTGEIFGSPLYMSPEQWRGGTIDERADIYSFGAVMYQALSGAPVFQGNDVLQLAFKHGQDLPEPLRAHGVGVPARLEAAIFRALAKEPEERFQKMRDLKQELSEINASLTTADWQVHTITLASTSAANDASAKDKTLVQNTSEKTQAWLQELTPANKKASSSQDKTHGPSSENTTQAGEAVPAANSAPIKFAAIALATAAVASIAFASVENLLLPHSSTAREETQGMTPPATPSLKVPTTAPGSLLHLNPSQSPSPVPARTHTARPSTVLAPSLSQPLPTQHSETNSNLIITPPEQQASQQSKQSQSSAAEPEKWQVVPSISGQTAPLAGSASENEPQKYHKERTTAVHKRKSPEPEHGLKHKLKQLLHKL